MFLADMSFANLLFENGYNHTEAELWMRDNWKSIGLTATIFYVFKIGNKKNFFNSLESFFRKSPFCTFS